MKNGARENLMELLQRFMDESSARAAHEEIQAGEQWLQACPAPAPEERVLAAIRRQMAGTAPRRHRIVRFAQAALATAAAIVVLALVGQLGPRPTTPPRMAYAALIPTAIWESDDLTTDDLDLAYYSSEIRQIEAQVRALEADDSEIVGGDAPDEIEMELLALQAEFWKG
jgi:hypothetical protein